MSIRAQRTSLGLAVLPLITVALLALILHSEELFVIAISVMLGIYLLVAHLIVAPIASFVAGLEKVADPSASPAAVLAAMPPEPVAVLALAATDAGNAIQQAAVDAGTALQQVAVHAGDALGFSTEEPSVEVSELPGSPDPQRSAAA